MSCLQENCNEKALYGFKQEKPKYCKDHKENGMVTKSNQYCSHNVLKSLCETCRGTKTIKKIEVNTENTNDDNTCKVQGCINIIYGYRKI